MAQAWEIVGGADKGGILVREGKDLKSPSCSDRLSTGAIVEELFKEGDRLQYKLKTGTGPAEGWISVKISGKDLAVPVEAEEEDQDPDKPPVKKPPRWRKVDPPEIPFGEIVERANKSMPGDYYGIKFPHDKDSIVKMGPEWLTQAFHKTGVLPRSNAVTKILDAKEFVGGGAGLKCIINVEYKIDKPYLHKQLFIKLPHKPEGSDRYFVSCMWNHDRPETIFNIWLESYIPYKVPKCYFADICADTTNFIVITESIKWTPKGTKEFKPGDVEPAYDKYMDWELPDGGPMYYHACCKALGKIAAYHKAGKLHPQVHDMFPMPPDVPQIPPGMPGMNPQQRKETNAKMDGLIKFVSETAKAVMPPEITDKAWLETWKTQAMHFLDYQIEVSCFMHGAGTSNPSDYVVLTHNNLQIDNAYFWHDDDNELQVGLLDWGVLACQPLADAVQGCISGAEFQVQLDHREDFLETVLSSYALYGGAELDEKRFKQMSDLQLMRWASGIIANVAQVIKHTHPKKEWPEIKDWMDPRLIGRFQTRAHTSQFKIALQMWRKLDLYSSFLEWLKQEGLPAKKE